MRDDDAKAPMDGGTIGSDGIRFERSHNLTPASFIDILRRSGLSERRPVHDPERIGRMLSGANLVVTTWDEPRNLLVGVARALSDFSYCCYLSDLAVDSTYQGRGIGRRLIDETMMQAGAETACILVSAPDAVGFYEKIGMRRSPSAFVKPRLR